MMLQRTTKRYHLDLAAFQKALFCMKYCIFLDFTMNIHATIEMNTSKSTGKISKQVYGITEFV